MADPKYAGLPGIDTNHPDTYETYSDHEIEGVLQTLKFLRIYTVIFCLTKCSFGHGQMDKYEFMNGFLSITVCPRILVHFHILSIIRELDKTSVLDPGKNITDSDPT